MENPLKWSGQFAVTPPATTQKLPGDKITLPQSALEAILSASRSSANTSSFSRPPQPRFNPYNPYSPQRGQAGEDPSGQRELPYPLTFRLVNPSSGRVVHSGIREFSANEGEVGLSQILLQSLGISESDFETQSAQAPATDLGDEVTGETDETKVIAQNGYPKVTVHSIQLSKGTYVRLRPLEAGYDVEDWKALLERHLRDNYTTLTVGEVLCVPVGRSQTFQLLVDKVHPEADAICIVDTDLEVDIEALDEEQARETLKRRLAKSTRAPESAGKSSSGGNISQGQTISGQVLRGEYVDYELQEWDRKEKICLELNVEDDEDADVEIFVSPFGARQRARPRADEHIWGDFSNAFPKSIEIGPNNVELNDAESIYVSVHAFASNGPDETGDNEQTVPLRFGLRIASGSNALETKEHSDADQDMHKSDEEQCKNCHQWVPKRTMILHENFCLRNNILCPKCQKVFQKRSSEWENHWHCDKDDSHGNNPSSKIKHDTIFHTIHACHGCQYEAPNLPDLAHHRTTVCPEKPILCQFCHLVVPQKGESDPDVFDPEVVLSGLTPHELADGGRTTECHLCNKIVRLRDMNTHLRHHELDRVSRPPPRVCINPNCSRTTDGPNNKGGNPTNDSLGLCNVCFGPLYVDLYDPEGKALRRRIERRYLSQMLTGCGKPWCRNEYCKTGRASLDIGGNNGAALTTKDILPLIKPLVDGVAVGPHNMNTCPLYYCTDENTQQRRKLAEMLAAEGAAGTASSSSSDREIYDVPWCIAAVESSSGDVEKARGWLRNWAPKKGEKLQRG